MFRPSSHAAGVLIAVLAVASCDGRDTTAPPPTPYTPLFQMSVEPSVLTVEPDMSGTATVNIVRRDDFTGEVVLSLANSTPDLTVSFDPATIKGTSSIVKVRAAATAPGGNYAFTIVATGGDVRATSTARLSVRVMAPLADWYFVAEPSELTVARGSSGQIEIHGVPETVEFQGGWVTYSLVNPPAGINADFESHYDSGYPATMTLFVPSTVSAGTYKLTLTTVCACIPAITRTIGLTVKDP